MLPNSPGGRMGFFTLGSDRPVLRLVAYYIALAALAAE
jgi:hypothetical protein